MVISISAHLKVQTMSVAFFDDCLLKTGTVPSSELQTIAFILGMADVEVTEENLQPHVDAMHPNGKCVASFITQQFA